MERHAKKYGKLVDKALDAGTSPNNHAAGDEHFTANRCRLAGLVRLREKEWLADYAVMEESLITLMVDTEASDIMDIARIRPADIVAVDNNDEIAEVAGSDLGAKALTFEESQVLLSRSRHYDVWDQWVQSNDTRYLLICSAHIAGSETLFDSSRVEMTRKAITCAAERGVTIAVVAGMEQADLAGRLIGWIGTNSPDVDDAASRGVVHVAVAARPSDIKLLYRRSTSGSAEIVVGSFNWLYEDQSKAEDRLGSEIGLVIRDQHVVLQCLDEVIGTLPEGDPRADIRSERAALAASIAKDGGQPPTNVKVYGEQRGLLSALSRSATVRFYVASHRCDLHVFESTGQRDLRSRMQVFNVDQKWVAENYFPQDEGVVPPTDLRIRRKMHGRCILADEVVVVGSQNYLSQFGLATAQLSVEVACINLASKIAELFTEGSDA